MNSSVAARVIGLIDLTNLSDDCSENDVVELCSRAHGPHGNVAAVCVWPRYVSRAVRELTATDVRVATVVNFPHGRDSVDQVVDSVKRCVADGADEIDLVLPYRAFLEGDTAQAAAMIDAVRSVVPTDSHVLKVILETGELIEPAAIHGAAQLAVDHGADFIKTSTGKTSQSATLEATAIMLGVIQGAGRPVGLKPSGGIRTLADATHFITQADDLMGPGWAAPTTFRFGASGLLTALIAAVDGNTGVTTSEAY